VLTKVLIKSLKHGYSTQHSKLLVASTRFFYKKIKLDEAFELSLSF